MSFLLQKLLGGSGERERPATPAKTKEPLTSPNYDLVQGKVYLVVGGKEDQILSNCQNCAAPFKGKLQQGCSYCGTSRQVHYLELSKAAIEKGMSDPEASLSIFGNEVNIGRDSYVESVIASQVVAEANLITNLIISRDVSTGPNAEIVNLVIQDGGTLSLGNSSYVLDELIIGRGVSMVFGDECFVKWLTYVERPSYKSGKGLKIGAATRISYKDFLETVSGFLG